MIAYLNGVLTLKSPAYVEVETGGVGYGLAISLSTFDKLPEVGSPVRLLTHAVIREDAHTLFAFLTAEERDTFRQLIGVSGIGPKAAVSILSTLDGPALRQAVLAGDAKHLCRVPGIGKKTAERLILELRDTLQQSGKIKARTADRNKILPAEGGAFLEDAIAALVTLGYSYADAHQAVIAVAETPGGGRDIENCVRDALKRLTGSA